MIKGGQTYRIITDHLGSVRLVVNAATGTVAQRIDYDEFGIATLVTGTWDVQPFGFAGGLYHPATGLVRFGARDYDPQTGRWTSKDGLKDDGGDANFYGYVGGDPLNTVDPRGLFVRNCSGASCIILPETGPPGLLPDDYIAPDVSPDGGVRPDGREFKVYGREALEPLLGDNDVDVKPYDEECVGGFCSWDPWGPFDPEEPWPVPANPPVLPGARPMSPEEAAGCLRPGP
jgi:RHS repeat-associated protein